MDLTIERWVVAEVNDLFSRIPVLEQRQFLRSLHLITKEEGYELTQIAKNLENQGIVLVTKNGYVTNKNAYDIVAVNEDVSMRENGINRIDYLEPSPYFIACMECFNIVLDLYPLSKDFHLNRDLFHITFTDLEKERIYELIRIPAGKEMFYEGLIVKESGIYKGKIGEHIRENTRRIALVESEACAMAVPYCGFAFICVPDKENSKGFRIVEKRKEYRWKDALSTD